MYTAAIPPFGSVTAEDVSYDPAPGYPPGTDNVQEALDYLVGATPIVAEMTPTVAGTAFGEQDRVKELNSLGEGVNIDAATARSTARYNAGIPGTPQAARYADCIFDDNRCSQDASTSLANSIASINETGIGSSGMSASTVIANTSTLTGTPVANSILHLNTTGAGGGSSCLDSAVITNSSSLNTTVLDRSVMLTTRMNGAGKDFTRSTIIGDATNAVLNVVTGAGFFASGGSQVVTVGGADSLYLGNQTRAETVAARDAMISSYDRFFLRTLRADSTTTDVVHYDPSTAEITYGPASSALALKQPTVLGGQYGINSAANASEVNGQNSFNNYAAGPASLSGVTAVGQQLYQNSVPGTNNFTNNIFLGRSHQFTGANLIQNSMIAASITGNVGITGISESCMIVPRAASLLLGYTGACTGANFHSSGIVTCTSDPTYSSVLSSGASVNPGVSNLVISQNLNGGLVTMSGSGNTYISSSSASHTFAWPAGINNATVIRSGVNAITPTLSGQLACSHVSFRMPNLTAGTPGNAVRLVGFSQANGSISQIISADFSRVLRRVGTTNAAGQVVFSTGTITPLADSAISLTVRNASTTTAYTAQVIAIGAASITCQVLNSTTVVLASPSMVASGAGIIVHMMMSY